MTLRSKNLSLGILVLMVAVICWRDNEVWALRPFDSTDADVTPPGKVEIELGLYWSWQKWTGPDEQTLELPTAVLNLGLPWESELVVEGVYELVGEGSVGHFDLTTYQLADGGVFFKKVWHRGKEWRGSFATETGLRLPVERDAEGIDFEGIGILTFAFDWAAVHLNLGGATTRVVEEFDVEIGEDMLTFERDRTRGVFIYGLASEVHLTDRLDFVSELNGEKVETERGKLRLLGGLKWESPWDIEFDAALFMGLNGATDDWGATLGLTYEF